MPKVHQYRTATVWTGNRGLGTANYTAYSRNHELDAAGKQAPIPGSSDAAFRGDGRRYSPEELLVASLSACHMLWVLHICADSGVVVTSYRDHAEGEMRENADGSGEFVRVTLRPEMTVSEESSIPAALAAHGKARRLCFIARSVNFTVEHEPVVRCG